MDYETSDLSNVFQELGSSTSGLTEEEAENRLEKYGFNELEEKRKITALKILVRQFANFIVWVLFAAAIISLIVGEELNFWVISSIIGFVIVLGSVQEYKAEKAMEALKKIVEPTATVLKDGKVREIMTRMVVPGDILLLESGDRIPADAKIFEVVGLKVDESALTGESISVEKKKGDLIFAGTQIVHGKCEALVIATGMQTKLGLIAGMIQEAEEQTPLQVKMAQLAKGLAIIALVACALTFRTANRRPSGRQNRVNI
jgi:Ca2+-transporting ATPase